MIAREIGRIIGREKLRKKGYEVSETETRKEEEMIGTEKVKRIGKEKYIKKERKKQRKLEIVKR